MSFHSVESSLSFAAKKLEDTTFRREKLIKESRNLIALSSRVIVSIHTSKLQDARKLRAQAGKGLSILRKVAEPDLVKYILMPEQEYVECSMMLAIAKSEKLPSIYDLGVMPSSYILGLLDAVGELKRTVYDSIRRGRMSVAEQMFSSMEAIYSMISPFAVYDNVIQGVKRKLDVARILIDDTRGTMTEEFRRAQFMTTLNKLSSKLDVSLGLEKKRLVKHA